MKWLACLVIGVLIAGLLWPAAQVQPVPQPVYLTPTITDPQKGDRDLITEINQRNSGIRTFMCREIRVSSPPIHLRGSLAYEKSRRFRCTLWSILGTELYLGSNDQQFWFWGKRLNPPALYHAKHEDLMKTRLKTPFNPYWMMEILGVDRIDTTNAAIVRNAKHLAVCQPRISTLGEKIVKITLIDPQRKLIIGHYIWKDGKIVVSAEITEFQSENGHIIPKRINFIWDEEDKATAQWEFVHPVVNASLSGESWKMPRMNRTIDMGVN